MDFQSLGAALAAALVLEKLFEMLFKPLWDKFGWDSMYKLYVAILMGSGLGYMTGLNAFPVFAMSEMVGRVLTALAIGCGTSFIYDLIDKGKEIELYTSEIIDE